MPRNATLSLVFVSLFAAMAACGKSNTFGSKAPDKPASGADQNPGVNGTGGSGGTGGGGGAGGGSGGATKSGQFAWQVLVERPVLDLVVIPDTSGGETLQSDRILNQKVSLQSRLETLAANVAKTADLKIVLLAPSRTTNVNLGMDVADFKHSNSAQIEVDSSIPGSYLLAVSAAASCNASLTRTIAAASSDPRLGVTQALEVCSTQPSGGVITGSYMDKMQGVSGKLTSQFRFGAKRAYLFLSTNEPKVFTRADFMKVFGAAGMIMPAVFSFHKASTDYQQLGQQTGGLDFDYNQTDWTKSFENLAQKLISVAGTEATVPSVTQIVSLKAPLKIQGNEVSENCFSARGNKISVSSQCVKDLKLNSAQVEVNYNYN